MNQLFAFLPLYVFVVFYLVDPLIVIIPDVLYLQVEPGRPAIATLVTIWVTITIWVAITIKGIGKIRGIPIITISRIIGRIIRPNAYSYAYRNAWACIIIPAASMNINLRRCTGGK
jgi:hypothetical protein